MKIIACSDIHLRTNAPVCRTDDWWEFQKERLELIFTTAVKHKCEKIIIVGDLYDHSDISKELQHLFLSMVDKYKEKVRTVLMPGNHSCPGHNTAQLHESKVALLSYADLDFVWPDKNFTAEYDGMMLIHQLTFEYAEDIPKLITAHCANDWLTMYQHPIILCGDGHKPFRYEKDGRLLINCGHTCCQKTSEMYESGVWLVDTDKVTGKYIALPDDLSFVSVDHITKQKERDERLDDVVEAIKKVKTNGADLDFWSQIKESCSVLSDGSKVEERIYSCRGEQ